MKGLTALSPEQSCFLDQRRRAAGTRVTYFTDVKAWKGWGGGQGGGVGRGRSESCVSSESETTTKKNLKGPGLVLSLRTRGVSTRAACLMRSTVPSLDIFKLNHHPSGHRGGLAWTSWLAGLLFSWHHCVCPLRATQLVKKDDFPDQGRPFLVG